MKSNELFSFIGPREYGIDVSEKSLKYCQDRERNEIGFLSVNALIKKIISEIEEVSNGGPAMTRLFFTKESKVCTLLNVLKGSGLPLQTTKKKSIRSDSSTSLSSSFQSDFFELDYLTQINVGVFEGEPMESTTPYFARIGLSPGAHDENLLDRGDQQEHALPVQPMTWVTDFIPIDSFVSLFERC